MAASCGPISHRVLMLLHYAFQPTLQIDFDPGQASCTCEHYTLCAAFWAQTTQLKADMLLYLPGHML